MLRRVCETGVGKSGIRRKAPESIGGRKAGKNIPGRNAAFGRRRGRLLREVRLADARK
ncbi:hypothetical protein V512_000275 [Mesotoga sp. Brook.08.105.5.1]|nr:hypothetical protein V512_000275 [Mesotoga sp. Brook.08.105.5.1]